MNHATHEQFRRAVYTVVYIQGNYNVFTVSGVDRTVTMPDIAQTFVSVDTVSIQISIPNRRHSVFVHLTAGGQS